MNGDEVLSAVERHSFDLYFLDNWLAGASGVELCRKLREVDPHTPILIYSGAAQDSDKKAAFEAGAQGYLVKPSAPDALLGEVLPVTRDRTEKSVTFGS
jgi:DNA-binding response OmpR family regulator